MKLENTDAPSASVTPALNYAVGDTDGYIMRVAYSVTVVGHYAPFPIIE